MKYEDLKSFHFFFFYRSGTESLSFCELKTEEPQTEMQTLTPLSSNKLCFTVFCEFKSHCLLIVVGERDAVGVS